MNLLDFQPFIKNRFCPESDPESLIAHSSGNYIICLRKGSRLPKISIQPTFTNLDGLQVIYTGISSSSLRTRDYKQHFKGDNAGRSTIRKSLGVLFGYKQIHRDKNLNSGKTKFSQEDERKLSAWMCENLILYFFVTSDFNNIEHQLINHFNPPLNIKDNKNLIRCRGWCFHQPLKV